MRAVPQRVAQLLRRLLDDDLMPGALALAAELLAKREGLPRAPESALAMFEALIALRDWEALADHLAFVRPFAGALAVLRPACDRAEGLLQVAKGDLDSAAKWLGRSLETLDRLGERYEAARTREALADISLTEGARDLLTQSLQQYEELGAKPDADRVRASLGSPGHTRVT